MKTILMFSILGLSFSTFADIKGRKLTIETHRNNHRFEKAETDIPQQRMETFPESVEGSKSEKRVKKVRKSKRL